MRWCSGPVAGACLFTELSLQFVFVWNCVIERRSLIMESISPPPFCSVCPSLTFFFFALQLFLFSLVYFLSKMLGQIQTCTHFTSTHHNMLACLHFLLSTDSRQHNTPDKDGSNKELLTEQSLIQLSALVSSGVTWWGQFTDCQTFNPKGSLLCENGVISYFYYWFLRCF